VQSEHGLHAGGIRMVHACSELKKTLLPMHGPSMQVPT
jgi:hypothetical protein